MHADTVAAITHGLTHASGSGMAELRNRGGASEQSQPWLDRFGWDSETYDGYAPARTYGRELPTFDQFTVAARDAVIACKRPEDL